MVRELNDEKRERFLTAALKLFVANGVQNTSTAEIAKEAGTASGTLFLYFPTKQALIDAILLKFAREQAENTKAQLEPSLTAQETFFTIWSSSIHWFLDHMEAYLYVQQVRDASMVSPAVTAETSQYFDYYYTAIQKGMEEGAIRPYLLDLIGGFLYQDIIAIMNYLRTNLNPGKQEEVIQLGFEIFWNGIKA